jgi:hypothetical protein
MPCHLMNEFRQLGSLERTITQRVKMTKKELFGICERPEEF